MTAATASTPSSARRFTSRWKAVLLIATLVGLTLWLNYPTTYHLATVQPGVLYRDGCQTPREFRTAVEKVKPRTVVSLIDDKERVDRSKPQFLKEEDFLGASHIKLVRIPIKLGGWPTREDVERFLEVTKDPANHPVLVHCAQGVRRTGMMVAAYQQAVLGMDDQKAKQALLTFGHSDRTASDVKTFIEGYDPKTGAVPEGLAASKE